MHGLPDQIVHASQVLLRFGRLRSPRVHWLIRGVDVNAPDVRAVLEYVDGSRHEPVIDLATVDRLCGADLLDPLGRWVLRREDNLSAAQKESDRLGLAGKQRRLP